MRLQDFVEAQRRQAASFDSPEFMRSIHSLVKSNKGHWKSDRQGKFLLKYAKVLWNMYKNVPRQKDAQMWAARHGFNFKGLLSDNCIVLGLVTPWGPAKRDPTKVRGLGWVVVVDEGGVAALGKAKVVHPKKGVAPIDEWNFVPGSITTTFERTEEPSITVDYFGANRRQVQQMEKQKKENQPLIQKIQKVPDYEDKEFLRDILSQLERGYKLTPRQMDAINKFLPATEQEDIGLGEYTEWANDLKQFGDLVQKRVVPALSEFYATLDEQQRREWDEADENRRKWLSKPDDRDSQEVIKSWWNDWMTDGYSDSFWLDSDLTNTLEAVMKLRVKDAHLRGHIWEWRDRIKKAIKTKGKRLAKKTISAILDLRRFNKRLSETSPQRIQKYWMDKLRTGSFKAASVSRRLSAPASIAELIRDGWDPASDGIYQTQPDPEVIGTSGVPENWEEDSRWGGNPNSYKREMNRCPPGYYSNDDGYCLPESPLHRKRRERINRCKPTRLKNRGTNLG